MWNVYFQWLNNQVNGFIGAQVANVSSLIEPAVMTLAVAYVMMWGYLHLTGKIEEPVLEGARRILILGVILIASLRLSQNINPILDIFVQGPQGLAQGIVGRGSPSVMTAVDTIWTQGAAVGDSLMTQGSLFSESGISLILCGALCYICVGLVTVYVAFLMSLALISLAILLAIGPIFISMLLFDVTKRFFEAWIAQLANYALIIVLVATVANLLLYAVNVPLTFAYAQGANVKATDALQVAVFCVLIILILRQILPIASALANGIALSSGGVISGMVRKGLGTSGNFSRGVLDSATGAYNGRNGSRWDPISRKVGQQMGYRTGQAVRATWRKIRPNEIKKRA